MQRLRAKCAGRVHGDDRVARGKTEAHRSMKPKSKEAKARFPQIRPVLYCICVVEGGIPDATVWLAIQDHRSQASQPVFWASPNSN